MKLFLRIFKLSFPSFLFILLLQVLVFAINKKSFSEINISEIASTIYYTVILSFVILFYEVIKERKMEITTSSTDKIKGLKIFHDGLDITRPFLVFNEAILNFSKKQIHLFEQFTTAIPESGGGICILKVDDDGYLDKLRTSLFYSKEFHATLSIIGGYGPLWFYDESQPGPALETRTAYLDEVNNKKGYKTKIRIIIAEKIDDLDDNFDELKKLSKKNDLIEDFFIRNSDVNLYFVSTDTITNHWNDKDWKDINCDFLFQDYAMFDRSLVLYRSSKYRLDVYLSSHKGNEEYLKIFNSLNGIHFNSFKNKNWLKSRYL